MSQLFFILALVCLFLRHFKWPCKLNDDKWKKRKLNCTLCCCCTRNDLDEADDESIKPLDPFDDDKSEYMEPSSIAVVYQHKQVIIHGQQRQHDLFSQQDTSTSTLLQGERLRHYNTWFAIGLVMIVTIGLTFFLVQYHFNQATTDQWELSTTICYTWSLIRTIVSCFVFSKLMYAIQRKCEEIEMYVYYANDNINKVKEYVKTKLTFQIKRAAIEMLKFTKSFNDTDDHASKKEIACVLRGRIEVPNNCDDQVYIAIIKAIGNKSNEIDTNESNNEEKEIKTILKEVEYNEINEQQYITQDNDRKIAQAKRHAYTINRLIKIRTKANENNDDGKKEAVLLYLKERDKSFLRMAVATLSWLQLWFLLHWLLYIISTFMILTVLIDAVALHVKYKLNHIEQGVGFHPVQIVFLCLYSLVQCFVLFYPCLRAAGVTRTRQRVIRKISDDAYKFTNLPEGVIKEFLESMKRRKFGFRLRILCASITFNLNIAYLSIAFGFVGIVVSLVNSVTS